MDCPPIIDIDRSIVIAMNDKAAIAATIYTLRQRHLMTMTATRAGLRCIGCFHLFDLPASFFRFVSCDQNEIPPACIRNTFRKVMVFDHALDVQLLELDPGKVSDQTAGDFKVKVLALASNFLMLFRQQLDCFLASMASKFSTRNLPPGRLKLLFAGSQEFRVLNLFARRERCEALNPDIDADRFSRRMLDSFGLILTSEANVPAVRLARDRTGFNFAFDWTRQPQANRADLREKELVAFNSKTTLWIREGIEPVLALESRVAGGLTRFDATKESVKGLVGATKDVLKDLRENLFQVRTVLLDFGKLNRLRMIVDRDAIHCVGVPSFLDGSVVQFAANVQRSRCFALEIVVHLQFVLKRFHLLLDANISQRVSGRCRFIVLSRTI